ncbi:Rid family hydrolase [Actinopolymorpha sp. B11F2]|uniref:Rid family hydrolase n=1 Tax=Actinopolymorpha sp. B11F2 TaxID=3160862 RepID=UPI0032E5140F
MTPPPGPDAVEPERWPQVHGSDAPGARDLRRPEFPDPADPELGSSAYAQAVRLGTTIETSGQGGWTRTRDYPPTVHGEVVQALDNVASVLAGAGASWDHVTAVHSYHVIDRDWEAEVDAVMSAELRTRMPSHAPIWTRVGLPKLGPRMHVEVRVAAVAPQGWSEMTRPEFFVKPGYGEAQLARRYSSQAVRVGNRVETAGQGGWSDDGEFPESRHDEIVQAFDNVERTLRVAGASWTDVISLQSYHTQLDDDEFGSMSGELRARIPTHAPIWTAVVVSRLGHPKMRVEIAVTAIVGAGE